MYRLTIITYALAALQGISNNRCLAEPFPKYPTTFSITISASKKRTITDAAAAARNYFRSVHLDNPTNETLAEFPFHDFEMVSIGIKLSKDMLDKTHCKEILDANYSIAKVFFQVDETQKSIDKERLERFIGLVQECFSRSKVTYVGSIESIMSNLSMYKSLNSIAFTKKWNNSLYESKVMKLFRAIRELKDGLPNASVHYYEAQEFKSDIIGELFNSLVYYTCENAPATVSYLGLEVFEEIVKKSDATGHIYQRCYA